MTFESLSFNNQKILDRLSYCNQFSTKILNHLPGNILITNKLGEIIHINPMAEKISEKGGFIKV
jgi:hypothetical protein